MEPWKPGPKSLRTWFEICNGTHETNLRTSQLRIFELPNQNARVISLWAFILPIRVYGVWTWTLCEKTNWGIVVLCEKQFVHHWEHLFFGSFQAPLCWLSTLKMNETMKCCSILVTLLQPMHDHAHNLLHTAQWNRKTTHVSWISSLKMSEATKYNKLCASVLRTHTHMQKENNS